MELVRSTIEAAGYDVLCAPDGNAALRLIPRCLRPLHLVVADLEMAPMSGIQMASEMKKITSHLPVLLLCSDGETPQNALGCWFLPKPFRPRVLIETVNKIVGREESPKIRPPDAALPLRRAESSQ